MDNIFILHGDKVFLRLMTELAVMHLARDWKLQINKSWNIHRTCDGIDFCGQRIFADHALLRKRTKHDLCAQVAKLRKRVFRRADPHQGGIKTRSHKTRKLYKSIK